MISARFHSSLTRLNKPSTWVNTFKILALSITQLALIVTELIHIYLFIFFYFQVTLRGFDRPSSFSDRPRAVIFEGVRCDHHHFLGLLFQLLVNIKFVIFIKSQMTELEYNLLFSTVFNSARLCKLS